MEKLTSRQKLLTAATAGTLAVGLLLGTLVGREDKSPKDDCRIIGSGALRAGKSHFAQDRRAGNLARGFDVYEITNLGPQTDSINTVVVRHAVRRIIDMGYEDQADTTYFIHDFKDAEHEQIDGTIAKIDVAPIADFPSAADFEIKICDR